jgi:hypothetical protein
MKAAIETGDLEAARVVHEAIGKLLSGAAAESSAVIDLAAERARRER